MIEDALAIQDDEHKLTRSSVGAKGYTVSSTRTSENAWVKDTKTAMRMKRRAFELLGFDHYDERMADGLQVLSCVEINQCVGCTRQLSRRWRGRAGSVERYAIEQASRRWRECAVKF